MRPGFESRTGNVFYFSFGAARVRSNGCTAWDMLSVSRLAQLVERKTLNLVVVGSSPTVGILFCFVLTFFFSVSFADVPEWLMG